MVVIYVRYLLANGSEKSRERESDRWAKKILTERWLLLMQFEERTREMTDVEMRASTTKVGEGKSVRRSDNNCCCCCCGLDRPKENGDGLVFV
jgi:hypothetical protein